MKKNKRKKTIVQEFKEFITRGNVIDLAVGMIIGAAFTAIIGSLVNDIFMPIIGFFIGKTQFSDLAIVLVADKLDASGAIIENGVKITYGNFIQSVVNFLIIALVVFLIVKLINSVRRRLEERKAKETEEKIKEAEATVPVIPEDIKLLTQIRDLLQSGKSEE